MDFGPKYYVVDSIDGDYAHLLEKDNPNAEDKLVARALLPDSIGEGSEIVYEMMSYRLA